MKPVNYEAFTTIHEVHYHTPQVYALRDWIPYDKINWDSFCSNPLVVFFCKKRPEYFGKIHWWMLSQNPNAVDFLEKNKENIDWDQLSKNTSLDAMSLVWANYHRINWALLSQNPSAFYLLEKNPSKINFFALTYNPCALELLPLLDLEKYDVSPKDPYWGGVYWEAAKWTILSSNPITPESLALLEANPDKIQWKHIWVNLSPLAVSLMEKQLLSERVNIAERVNIEWHRVCRNPYALSMIEKRLKTHPEDIDWLALSTNPAALSLLKKYPENIHWKYLSWNPHPEVAFLLEENQDKIDWETFSSNHNMFSYDYPFLKNRANIYKEELVAAAMHPRRIARMMEQTEGELEGFL